MAKPGAKGFTRIVHATGYSIKGLKAGFKNEAAFRQETILALIMIICAIFVAKDKDGFNVVHYALLITGPFLVMTAEILNSAIESVVDRVGNEYHELSGRAKDMGSAAVFIMLVYTFVVWTLFILKNVVGLL
ncbi:MAG: diacylglycerol kinase [Succinivibrionaceae bacterium]